MFFYHHFTFLTIVTSGRQENPRRVEITNDRVIYEGSPLYVNLNMAQVIIDL